MRPVGTLWEQVTFADLARTALLRHPERLAFATPEGGLTYAAAADRVGRLARVLARRGVTPGSGVAILSVNRADAWLARVAASMLGARTTGLHPLGSLEDHAFICGDAEVGTLVFDPGAYEERATEVAERVDLGQLLSLGPASGAEDLLALGEAAPAGPLTPAAGEDDIATISYTGGTTGQPKGAVLPHRALVTQVLTVLACFELPRQVRYLAASPITHAAGMMVLPTLLRGGTVHLQATFDPAAYLGAIARERITLCFGVPTMVYALLDAPVPEGLALRSLETFIYAASPMSPARLGEAIDRFGPVFLQFYGQTECHGCGTVMTRDDHDRDDPVRLASCGTPVPSVRMRLAGDAGRPVGTGEVGEICLRGRSVMDGYWKRPDLSAEALRDGWLHTGDLATCDERGFVTIVDRTKDMIVSGGFNVFPREVEDVLSAHPAVSLVAVVGVPDERWGEAVKAVVVPRPGATPDPDELIALVRRRKGPVYAPKTVDFVDTMPLTRLAKIDKRALRARYWHGQDRSVH